jgi:hypothetical protein
MTIDEARKYILQNWFDGDENVNSFVCGDEEYTAMAIAVRALEATMWHYPSKGEMPDKDVECLVHTKSGNNFIAMIDSSDNCWCTGEFFSEYLRDDYVLAWQYIVPPEKEKI